MNAKLQQLTSSCGGGAAVPHSMLAGLHATRVQPGVAGFNCIWFLKGLGTQAVRSGSLDKRLHARRIELRSSIGFEEAWFGA